MSILSRFFGKKTVATEPKHSSVSGFFRHASSSDKERLVKEVTKKANRDQRDLVDRYERLHP